MSAEILNAFQSSGLTLNKTLVQMLDGHFSHCTERRGCGFTQATRFLSSLINQPRDNISSQDLRVFSKWPGHATEELAQQLVDFGWDFGWRNLDKAPDSILEKIQPNELLETFRGLMPKIRLIQQEMELVECALFLNMLHDLLSASGDPAPEIMGMKVKPEIGSCSQAEEFFLEIANGRVRRGGSVNVIVSQDGSPIMVEKMNLGESHSAVVVSPINIFNVLIPPGSLCALKYSEDVSDLRASPHGKIIPLANISEARFLRLTTLSVPPDVRKRAFGPQVEVQIRGQMLSPTTTVIDQLLDFAVAELSGTDK